MIMIENCFIKGVENKKSLIGNNLRNKVIHKFKLFTYMLFTAVFSPYVESKPKQIMFMAGKAQRKKKLKRIDCFDVYWGVAYFSIGELIHLPTPFFTIKRGRRLSFLINRLLVGMRNKTYRKDMIEWLEFSIVDQMLSYTKPEEVISRGHVDEISTWFGELSSVYAYKFVVYQHGVVGENLIVKNKIHYDTLYVFDDYSAKFFKKYILDGAECKIEKFENDKMQMSQFKKNQKFLFALGEQDNPKWVNNIMKRINTNKVSVIINVHPKSKFKLYYKLRYSSAAVTMTKYSNVDVIISDCSSLLVDYAQSSYDGLIYYTDYNQRTMFEPYSKIQFIDICDVEKLISRL